VPPPYLQGFFNRLFELQDVCYIVFPCYLTNNPLRKNNLYHYISQKRDFSHSHVENKLNPIQDGGIMAFHNFLN